MAKRKTNGLGTDAEAPAEVISNTNADDTAEAYVEYTEYMGQIARIRQKIGTMLSRYENMGVHTKSVRACYRLANMDDAPDYVREMLRTAAILKIIPAAEESDGQMTFLPGLKVAPPSPEAAAKVNNSKNFWDGHDAGASGDLMEACKAAPGTEEYVIWEKGWKAGREDWAAKPKNQNTTAAPTEVRKRGRRAAEKEPETALEKDEAAFRGPGPDIEGADPITIQ